jgi:hypothetical protein
VLLARVNGAEDGVARAADVVNCGGAGGGSEQQKDSDQSDRTERSNERCKHDAPPSRLRKQRYLFEF